MNFDCRHKHYGFPEVFEQPKSISLSECSRVHVWAGRGCVPPLPVTLPTTQPINQCPPTGFHACPPTLASARGGTSPQPHCVCLLCCFPISYRCFFTTTLHTQPQNLRNVHCKHPWRAHIPCALLDHKFSGDACAFFSFSTDFSTILIKCKTFFFSIQPDTNSNE